MSNINCGCLQFLKRDSIVSSEFQLERNQTYTIGTCPQNDIRIKVQTVVPEYIRIKAKRNGLVKFLSNSVTQCKINNKPVRGSRYLEPGDVIFILGKKFRYENVFYSKGDIKTMQKLERSLCNDQILKSNITNRRHTVVVKRNVIRTPVSLKGSKTPAPKHSRNFFLEEDIENQPVTPSTNNSISVYTLQTRQVFNTPQSIGTNKEGKDLSFLQQINFNFGDNPSSSRSFVINKEDSENASASIDEDAPDHSPINSFTLNIGDFPNNTLIDVTDPGLVINDDVGNSSRRAKLKVLGEISPNNWSTGEGNRRSGRKSSALKMNRSELIASTPSNVRVSRKKSVFIPFKKTLHFEHLTNRSTPKSVVQQSIANVSFASCGAKTSRRSILKKKIDSSVLSNNRSRRSIRTSRDNTARKSITTRSSKSMIESFAMQNQKGPNNQATKSLTLHDSDVSHSFVYSLPIFQKNEFVTQRKSSKNTSTSKNQTNLLDNDCAKIAIGSCSASGSDYGENVVDMADIDNTHTSDVVLKSPSGYLDFASSSEATDILEFSNHENSLDETMLEHKIRPDRKPLGTNCGVKRTRRESKSLDISSRESKKFKRAKSDMDRIRRSIFNVNRSDLSEEADDEEQESIEVRNASEESSEVPPADDSSILVDSEDAPESTQTCKTPKNDSRAVRTSRSTLFQTSKAQGSPENCSNAVRRSNKLFKTPTVEQSLQNNSRYLSSSTKLSKTPTIEEGDIGDLKRNNNFNVNRSDISEETDEEEEEAKLLNASDETSNTIPSDDSSILEGTSEFLDLSSSGTNLKSNNTLDVSEESGQARKTTKKYAIAAGSDTSELLQTSKSEEFSGNDSKTAKRVSKLLKTPTLKQSLQHEARSVRRSSKLLKTPAGNDSPKIDSRAVRSNSKLLNTPTVKQSPQYGTRRSSSKLLKTPSIEEFPKIDLRAVRSSSKLLNTVSVKHSPQYDVRRSSNKLHKIPSVEESPKIDPRPVSSSSKLLKTPTSEESPKIYSNIARSSSRLFKTPTVEESDNIYDVTRSDFSEQADTEEQAIDLLNASEDTSDAPPLNDSSILGGIEEFLDLSPKGEHFKSDDSLNVPEKVEERTLTHKTPEDNSKAVRSNRRPLLQTSKAEESPGNHSNSVKGVRNSSKHLKTPTVEQSPQHDTKGVRSSSKLLKTPSVEESPKIDSPKAEETPGNNSKAVTGVRSSSKHLKTPTVEQSPQHDTRGVRSSRKLPKTPSVEESPKIDSKAIRSSSTLLKTPTTEHSQYDARSVRSSNKLLKTSRVEQSPQYDSRSGRGSNKLLKTPTVEQYSQNVSRAVRSRGKLLKTPAVKEFFEIDSRAVRSSSKLLKTPSVEESPKNYLKAARISSNFSEGANEEAVELLNASEKIMATPKVQKLPHNDLSDLGGVKKMFSTPKLQNPPKNDLTNVRGVKELLKTPKLQKLPRNDLTDIRGVKKMFSTPKFQNPPKNDLSDVKGVKRLLNTPKVQKLPRNDLSDVSGVNEMFSTPKPPNIGGVRSLDHKAENDTTDNRDPFDILTNRKPIRTYKSKSPIGNVQIKIHGVEEDTPATVVDWVKNQNKLLNDEVNEKPATPKVQTHSTRQTRRNKTEDIKADPDDNSPHIQKLLRPTRQTRRNKDQTLSHHVGSVELREEIEGPDAHSTPDIQKVPRPIRQTRKNKETALEMPFQSQTGEITASSSQGIIDEQSSHTPNIRARPLRLIPKNKGTPLVKSNQVEPVKIAASSSDKVKDEQNNLTPNIRERPLRQTRKNKGRALKKSNQVEAVEINQEIKTEPNNKSTTNIQEPPKRQTRRNKTETSNLNQKGSNQDEINDKTSNVNNDVDDLVEETKKRTRRGIKSSNNEKQDTQSSVKAKCEEDGTASTKKRVRQRSRPRKNKIEEGSNDVNKEEEQENVHTKNSYAVKTQSPIRTEAVKIEKDEQILSRPRRGKRKAGRKLPPQADTPIKTDGEKIDDDLIVITDSRQTRRNAKNANLGSRQKATNHNDVEKSIEERTLNSGKSRRSSTKRKQSAKKTDDEEHDEMLSLRRGRGKGKLEKETASSSETAELRRSKRTRRK